MVVVVVARLHSDSSPVWPLVANGLDPCDMLFVGMAACPVARLIWT
jgi:hypothetical protein